MDTLQQVKLRDGATEMTHNENCTRRQSSSKEVNAVYRANGLLLKKQTIGSSKQFLVRTTESSN